LWYAFSCHSSSSESCIFLLVPRLPNPYSIIWWPNVPWIQAWVDDMSSYRQVNMVIFQGCFVGCSVFAWPLV
jgi:hypothetical protein